MKAQQQGIALAVALILLAILTLLAVSGMGMATAELAMAGNEQLRRRASEFASAGIERALLGLPAESEFADEGYQASVRFAGQERSLPGFSGEKFVGHHYVIESTGSAPRGARDVQVQGVLVISARQNGAP